MGEIAAVRRGGGIPHPQIDEDLHRVSRELVAESGLHVPEDPIWTSALATAELAPPTTTTSAPAAWRSSSAVAA